jgi:ribosomal protein L32
VFAHGFPDDEIVWTLSEERRAENRAHSALGQGQAPALIPCPACSAIRRVGRACPACGWMPTRKKPKQVPVADGDLRGSAAITFLLPFTSRSASPGRRRSHAVIRPTVGWPSKGSLSGSPASGAIGPAGSLKNSENDSANGLARRVIEPLVPDAAIRAWVRERHLAFAKAQSPGSPRSAAGWPN